MKKNYFLVFTLFSTFFVNAQFVSFSNAAFKARMTVQSNVYGYARDINGSPMIVDTNNNGEIEYSEALQVYEIYLIGSEITNLGGIHNFTNLRILNCYSCEISSLNVSMLPNLQTLYCENNNLVYLNVAGLSHLRYFNCEGNELNTLDVSGCSSLFQFWCSDNHLTAIDVSDATNLDYFRCDKNNLTSLDVSGLSHLTRFNCNRNSLASLNLTGCSALRELDCTHNQLSSLSVSDAPALIQLFFGNNPISAIDLSANTQINWIEMGATLIPTMDFSQLPTLHELVCTQCSLTTIDVSHNYEMGEIVCQNSPQLTSIFMKNGSFNSVYASLENDTPKYICADEEELFYLSSTNYMNNITANSYCSFTPGGTFYVIEGNNKFDGNNNGCDASDHFVPNINYNITNGTATGNIIADQSGHYTIPVQAGTHTITPQLPNPNYYTITPSSAVLTLPATQNPVVQDFCVTLNGVHHDLEITMLPENIARPGFDVQYKIIYSNNGTVTQSGSVALNFGDDIVDFITSVPEISSQSTNALRWEFTDLQPFESREISLTFNINSPIEMPPVNNGTILYYTAALLTVETDETPSDNSFDLQQTVVNSMDPNHKICLEGSKIGPEAVGKYVHYLIYFENSGTASAQNIVVKDMIDVAKFDITSLIPLDGSHPFLTKISNTNKVEFVFENINLPYDNDNNDGYVAFKIKTKPTLVLGDTFTNTASIYFDYNAAIVTNDATTTIAALATQDFEFSDYFELYPNPAATILNLVSKKQTLITSINVYNILGQLLLTIPNASQVSSIDISNLKTGNYFIKINSEKGTTNAKFAKN